MRMKFLAIAALAASHEPDTEVSRLDDRLAHTGSSAGRWGISGTCYRCGFPLPTLRCPGVKPQVASQPAGRSQWGNIRGQLDDVG